MLWKIMATATDASAIASIKVWFEEIGLKGGRLLPPVRALPSAEADDVRANLKRLGVT